MHSYHSILLLLYCPPYERGLTSKVYVYTLLVRPLSQKGQYS